MCNSKELASKFMNFNFVFAQWTYENIKKNFNINGKGGFSLTIIQFNILIAIEKFDINTISELEKLLKTSKSSLSLTISKLEKGGYIKKKQPDKNEDCRKVYIIVTDKGREALEEINKNVCNILADFFDNLTKKDKENLKQGIEVFENIFCNREEYIK